MLKLANSINYRMELTYEKTVANCLEKENVLRLVGDTTYLPVPLPLLCATDRVSVLRTPFPLHAPRTPCLGVNSNLTG